MPATRPSTRIQRRAQPTTPRRSSTRRRTASVPTETTSEVRNDAPSFVATALIPDNVLPTASVTTLDDESMQKIVSAVTQAVLTSIGGARTTPVSIPSSSSAMETREIPIVSANNADAIMQGPVASALRNLSVLLLLDITRMPLVCFIFHVLSLIVLFALSVQGHIYFPLDSVTYWPVGSHVKLPWTYNFSSRSILSLEWRYTRSGGNTFENVATKSSGNTKPRIHNPLFNVTDQATLEFKNANFTHNGTYSLRVRFFRGGTRISSVLVIIFIPPVANITCNSSVALYEGDNFLCICNGTAGDSQPSVSWYKNNKIIGTTAYRSKKLSLTNVNKTDNGTYLCRVQSHTLADERPLEITVFYKPTEASATVSQDKPTEASATVSQDKPTEASATVSQGPPLVTSIIKISVPTRSSSSAFTTKSTGSPDSTDTSTKLIVGISVGLASISIICISVCVSLRHLKRNEGNGKGIDQPENGETEMDEC